MIKVRSDQTLNLEGEDDFKSFCLRARDSRVNIVALELITKRNVSPQDSLHPTPMINLSRAIPWPTSNPSVMPSLKMMIFRNKSSPSSILQLPMVEDWERTLQPLRRIMALRSLQMRSMPIRTFWDKMVIWRTLSCSWLVGVRSQGRPVNPIYPNLLTKSSALRCV